MKQKKQLWQHHYFKISLALAVSLNSIWTYIAYIQIGYHDQFFAISFCYFILFYLLPFWGIGWHVLHKSKKKNGHWKSLLVIIGLSFMGTALLNLLLQFVFIGSKTSFFMMMVYLFPMSLITCFLLYFGLSYVVAKKQAEDEQLLRQKAQLETLRYQINPHFLFNSLNTISSFIRSKPDQADGVLHDLAAIFRYSLDTSSKNLVPLSEEIESVERYLNIEKARFGDLLNMNFDIPQQMKTIEIPPLLLQPLIENAIKHGMDEGPLKIDLNISIIESSLHIVVADNGPGFTKKQLNNDISSGIGLSNIQQRVELINGGSLSLSNQDGAVVHIVLDII